MFTKQNIGDNEKVDIYEDVHNEVVSEHYHLGSNRYDKPDNQLQIYKEIIELLKNRLPNHLCLRFNNGNNYGVNIIGEGNRTFVYLNCYNYKNEEWRVKIIPNERGRYFFESFLKPLIESI